MRNYGKKLAAISRVKILHADRAMRPLKIQNIGKLKIILLLL